jgi:hypothetical protein
VHLELTARNLLVVSWEVDEAALTADLPAAVRPALLPSGRGLVSLVALRASAPTLGRLRAPSFCQLWVRTYVIAGEEHAIFIYGLRTGIAGLGGVAFGMPVRPARIRVQDGRVSAPGLGVELRYRHDGRPSSVPALEGTEIGSQSAVYVMSAGVRRLWVEHSPFRWEAAELLTAPRIDPVLALGFDLGEPVSVLYAERTALRTELPPSEVG